MYQAGIEKFYSVTSIRKASITKAIQQGASQIQINRFSRHADGTSTVQVRYDTNLNDDIRRRLGTLNA
ncbi:MAG: hypothetical protein EZS28_023043 [Streblomastix strix]|uniref:Tyr recombinase domain-containing protein n=1 Tax=Streblomastix strix TaxID=222440 RepID=A0A5J4VGC2_9EUKA|nr:MAG: hypothetical protein EZS28_023043 [Streblomastix strix]